MKSSGLALGAALALSLPAAEAQAAGCSLVDVAGVGFWTYDVFDAAPLDSTGYLRFICDGLGPSDALVIELSAGAGPGAWDRRMTLGDAALHYNLFLDPARTRVWGNGMNGTATYGPFVPPNGVTQTAMIYARVPARQNVPYGAYADTIVATILY